MGYKRVESQTRFANPRVYIIMYTKSWNVMTIFIYLYDIIRYKVELLLRLMLRPRPPLCDRLNHSNATLLQFGRLHTWFKIIIKASKHENSLEK